VCGTVAWERGPRRAHLAFRLPLPGVPLSDAAALLPLANPIARPDALML
jgi:hypothetical protein